MLGFLLNIIKIVFLLGFLIFIHESGHFLVAKLFKVKVLEFAIGFGPTIWSKQEKETKYALRLIPLGGFVNMLGEEERSEEEGAYNKASIPKRMGILVAGGLVNIVFGILVFFMLICTSNSGYIATTVKQVVPDYAAEIAGIQQGDKILKINNENIKIKSDIDNFLVNYSSEPLKIEIERNEEKREIILEPTEIETKTIGVFLGVDGKDLSTEIKSLYKDSPAEKAGIIPGDIIISVNNIEITQNAYQAVELIQNSNNEFIQIEVRRGEKILKFDVTPEVQKSYKLGIVFNEAEPTIANRIYYGFWESVRFSSSIVENLKQLFSGNVGVDQLMGPVGISEVVVDTQNIVQFVYILALISLSLGITNLLPFPPLDGGKVVILIIEAIRRKPMKEKVEITIQMIGFFIIIALSIFVTFNDITRIL